MPDELLPSAAGVLDRVRGLLRDARHNALTAVNIAMVQAYWNIGREIVEEEQRGAERADYGSRLLEMLSQSLTAEFGKEFDASNLRYMRLVYLAFPIRDALRHGRTCSAKSDSRRSLLSSLTLRSRAFLPTALQECPHRATRIMMKPYCALIRLQFQQTYLHQPVQHRLDRWQAGSLTTLYGIRSSPHPDKADPPVCPAGLNVRGRPSRANHLKKTQKTI